MSVSSGLMSCVRESSPPLELDGSATGPLSLPDARTAATMSVGVATSTPLSVSSATSVNGDGAGAAPTADQQKRRRFHPLRNLRRIFRRRTITSVAAAPDTPTSSVSEKNLRSATLSAHAATISASSPSSPLSHQQLQDAYLSQSLPKSKSYSSGAVVGAAAKAVGEKSERSDALLAAGGKKHKPKKQSATYGDGDNVDAVEMYTSRTTTTTSSSAYNNHHQQQQQQIPPFHQPRIGHSEPGGGLFQARQSIGVAVLPPLAMGRNFFAERQKLRSVGDSSQELDSSGNDSGSISIGGAGSRPTANEMNGTSASNGEMSDSQRSLSEGRLIDCDYSHDALSQSHDSVFSESATASSLSIVLKAELADVLRKRRQRPDASDEDLGLPRSPASPQRRTTKAGGHGGCGGGGGGGGGGTLGASSTAGNQSEVSSLSLMSMNSNDGDEALAASTANSSAISAETLVVQERCAGGGGGASLRYTRASNVTSVSLNADVQLRQSPGGGREQRDEVDLFSCDWQRLSHAAAKHKMALRPAKKKGPSRQHRRTLENSIPEANEDFQKASSNQSQDVVDEAPKAKTRSLPPGINAKALEQLASAMKSSVTVGPSSVAVDLPQRPLHAVHVKRSKTEKAPAAGAAAAAADGPAPVFSATNLFGFRALSTKATAMFHESKEPAADVERKEVSTSTTTIESSESGFLRRLMQRNSKRTIARANAGDTDADSDPSQSEPKKLQTSSSCCETQIGSGGRAALALTLDKSRSSMSYEQNVQETRKEIKREILAEGSTGLSAMLNSYMLAERSGLSKSKEARSKDSPPRESPAKPKSGPAARQRYLPQDITPELSPIEKQRTTPSVPIAALHPQLETFQSTSIIREITASQSTLASSKSDHLYEKNPKIVGLSAFQQKISRSNDSFPRTSSTDCTSSNSLETSGETVFVNYESREHQHRQRKAVEKSRSFRTYAEERERERERDRDEGSASGMPSLPDLTLTLRVPTYGEFVVGGGVGGATHKERSSASPSPPTAHDKSVSLGFEINDNTLVQHASRAESTGQLSGHTQHGRNVILSSSTGGGRTTSAQLLTAATVVPSLSPTCSCNNNISEIEQNIDLIVKSPFVSVLRKSATFGEELVIPLKGTLPAAVPPAAPHKDEAKPPAMAKVQESPVKVRPKVLQLKQSTAASDAKKSSPTGVSLRGKATKAASEGSGRNTKEPERKSAPAAPTSSKAKATRRSASVVEPANDSGAGGVGATAEVPEFLKIQLNRVDPARIAKSNVLVLAKNVKAAAPKEAPQPADELCMRRLSNESVDISEKSSPEPEDGGRHAAVVCEAINRQTKALSSSSVRSSGADSTPSPSSPLKKTFATISPTDAPETTSPIVQLRAHSTEPSAATTAGNKLSLQERKRIFLGGEERSKTDKKLEELRNERKKSISEELRRKSLSKSGDEKTTMVGECPPPPQTMPSPQTPTEPAEPVVVLRKKSFGGSLPTHANSLNGSHASSNNNNNNNHSNNNNNGGSSPINTNKAADPTPELMKVFARRSLKIKDEDLQALSEKINATANGASHAQSPGSMAKKFVAPAQNVDSDKENQSSSEEKLDRLAKNEGVSHESPLHSSTTATAANNCAAGAAATVAGNKSGSNGSQVVGASHRNSFADFRSSSGGSVTHKNGSAGVMLSNNNNSNNGVQTSNGIAANGKVFLPALRASGGFRTLPIERNGSASKLYSKTTTTTAMSMTSISHSEISVHGSNNNNHTTSHNNHHNGNGYNNNNNNVAGKPPTDRQSLGIRHRVTQQQMESSSPTATLSKTIERSATVGEFKGIHQRRAEWEQRAKEALK